MLNGVSLDSRYVTCSDEASHHQDAASGRSTDFLPEQPGHRF